jgi:hypothetical protein
MSQGNVGRVWLKFIDISTQQNTNNDYTECNTCKPMHVVTDLYDILNTPNMGKYLWIVIHV